MKILDVALDNGLSLMHSSDRTSSPSLRLSASSVASPRSQPSFNSLPPLPAQNSATNSGTGNLASSIWLVNEYFDGCKLHDYIRLRGRLDEDEARAIFLQVVSAVLYAHRLHMLYRELLVDCIPYLKPENIYLSFSKMSTTHVLAPVASMNAKVASKERKPRRQAQASSSSSIPLSKRDQPHASSSNSTGTILNPPAALSARAGTSQSTKHARHRSIPSLAAILQLSPPGSSATLPSTPPTPSANSSSATTSPTPPTMSSRNYPVVKVGLYGFSKSLHPSAMSTSYFAYAAPEVAAGSYGHNHANGQLIDSWTCGVLLYIMITGSFPFAGEDDEEHHQFITKGKWSANDPYLNVSSSNPNLSGSGIGSGISTPKAHDSNALKDLLSQLLTPIPSDRLHLSAAIKHPWCLMASLENSTAVPLVASSSLYSSSTDEMSSSSASNSATTLSGKGPAATTTISFSSDVSPSN